MKGSVFSKNMKRLEAAFRVTPLSEASMNIYYEKLKHIDDTSFTEAVERAIEEEHFFPSIAQLKLLADSQSSYDASGRRLKIIK